MFDTCVASDSCILRESTHFRSYEHATEISPGKPREIPIECSSINTAHWYSEGNFLRNPLQYRHASSFDKITALSRGLSYRKSFVAIIYDNNFTKPHKKIRRIYFARINRTIASYRRNGVRLHRMIAFELSQLDIRRFVYVKLRSATRHFCDTASPVSIVIHDKQSAEYKVE